MSLRFAYNTNGAAHHRLEDALGLIADAGYDGVALTLDHHHLDPYAPDLTGRAAAVGRHLAATGLGCVVETGARFLLDPRAKHEPTLVSPEAEGRVRRLDLYRRAFEVAAACEAEAVSFWSGRPRPGVDPADARGWLLDGLVAVAAMAQEFEVDACLEPSPGMLIETNEAFALARADAGPGAAGLKLSLDTGHCLVVGEESPDEAVRIWMPELGTVAIEDMRLGVHEHLAFGEGDMDVAAVLEALVDIRFERLVCVELSRDSHRAPDVIAAALSHLRSCEKVALAAAHP